MSVHEVRVDEIDVPGRISNHASQDLRNCMSETCADPESILGGHRGILDCYTFS
jgi:hypothetical protein